MEAPIKPDESDCCNSGCNPCILDVYEEKLRKFLASSQVPLKPQKNCLLETSFSVFQLVNVEKHCADCSLYTFEYVGPQRPLKTVSDDCLAVQYEPGQHFMLKAFVDGDTYQKGYTPLFVDNQAPQQFTVVFKFYKNGKMSRFFRRLKVGSKTLWRGPYGDFKVNFNEQNVLFVAQGTGIAPFYNIIRHMLDNENCFTFIQLFFCCNTDNIILRDYIYKLGDYWNFKYELFLSGGNNKEYFKEKYNETVHFCRLRKEHFKAYLNSVKGSVKVLVCGSDVFCSSISDCLRDCGVLMLDVTVF